MALAILALATAASTPDNGAVVDGMAFGPSRTLTCKWFTNFENSRLEQCSESAGSVLPSDEGASIKCLGQTCEQLDAEARKASNWQKAEPPWGTFTMRLVRRVSLHDHKPQFIGDGTSTVRIEKVLDVRTAK